MIGFILPKPKRNCSGVILVDEFFPLPSVTSTNYMSAPSSSFRLLLKKWPEESTPRWQPPISLGARAGAGLQPGTTQQHRTVCEVFKHWYKQENLSLARPERDF